jgi:hypothetical protein
MACDPCGKKGTLLRDKHEWAHPAEAKATQTIKYTQDLLHCTVHKISFPIIVYLPKSDSEQESYVYFTSAMKFVLKF